MASAKAAAADVEAPDERTPLYSPENEPPPLKEMKENTLKERAVAGTAAVAFSTSIAAMLLEHNPSVYVSGGIGCVVAPYAAIQQEKITQVEALKQTNERLTEEVQQLQDENVRLQNAANELESSVLQ
jgi:demethoxyubiquinone hydroxylase (CLK1/Coq7/Cat5 family)